jgi:hypothetical protein
LVASRVFDQGELHPLVGRAEAERLVEAVRVGARLVGAELREARAALTGPSERPLDELVADTATAQVARDPHALDVRPGRTPVAEVVQQGELERSDHLGRRGMRR